MGIRLDQLALPDSERLQEFLLPLIPNEYYDPLPPGFFSSALLLFSVPLTLFAPTLRTCFDFRHSALKSAPPCSLPFRSCSPNLVG